MNVYDFDKTIYKRDSTTDFFIRMLFRHPIVFVTVPGMAVAFIRYYIFKRGTKTEMKEKLYKFLKYIDVKKEVSIFWQKNLKDVKRFYIENRQDDDLIISAAPEFVIEPICKILGIRNFMGSKVDPKTGVYSGINCHGEEKVRRFREKFSDSDIDDFYSDSYSDQPLALLAKKAYMVNGDKITPWKFK